MIQISLQREADFLQMYNAVDLIKVKVQWHYKYNVTYRMEYTLKDGHFVVTRGCT